MTLAEKLELLTTSQREVVASVVNSYLPQDSEIPDQHAEAWHTEITERVDSVKMGTSQSSTWDETRLKAQQILDS